MKTGNILSVITFAMTAKPMWLIKKIKNEQRYQKTRKCKKASGKKVAVRK